MEVQKPRKSDPEPPRNMAHPVVQDPISCRLSIKVQEGIPKQPQQTPLQNYPTSLPRQKQHTTGLWKRAFVSRSSLETQWFVMAFFCASSDGALSLEALSITRSPAKILLRASRTQKSRRPGVLGSRLWILTWALKSSASLMQNPIVLFVSSPRNCYGVHGRLGAGYLSPSHGRFKLNDQSMGLCALPATSRSGNPSYAKRPLMSKGT